MILETRINEYNIKQRMDPKKMTKKYFAKIEFLENK